MGAEVTTQEIYAVVQRIVESVHPLRIVLFGSAARGEAGPDSDVDILVVMPDGAKKRETAQFLHTQLFGIPLAVDIVVSTPTDIERHKDNVGMIYQTIAKEGREIYAA